MRYQSTVYTKDGAPCLLRNAEADDAEAVCEIFKRTHGQTEYLLSYPDESSFTVEQEREFLKTTADSDNSVEICAYVDGVLVGTAGIGAVGRKDKQKHRAEFGISIDENHQGRGIGRALTEACIECAKKAGYMQLELEVVADNKGAVSLYNGVGFREYGRNPRGFKPRKGDYQELVLMRMELD